MPDQVQNHPLQEFYSKIYTTYDRVNRIFTFGQDAAWRKMAAGACLKGNPASVLDVCTGTGDFILEVKRQAGNKALHLEGYDFTREMLEVARRKGPSISFTEGTVADMPYKDGQFEAIGITFGIRNLLYENEDAKRHLEEIYRVLKKGGRLVVLESSKPDSLLWQLFNNIYLQFILPYLGALFSGNLKAYRYLAKSSRNYYSKREMASILEAAGFKTLSSRSLFLGSVMLLVAGK